VLPYTQAGVEVAFHNLLITKYHPPVNITLGSYSAKIAVTILEG
jgi:hypothetical protein